MTYQWNISNQTVNIDGEIISLEKGKNYDFFDEDVNKNDFLKSCFLKGYLKKISEVESIEDIDENDVLVDDSINGDI